MATQTHRQHRNANGYTREQWAQAISGTYNNPEQVRAVLDNAERNYNVLGTISFGELPEGFSVALSTVKVDVNGETYEAGPKRGLGSPALRRIAGAAGISNVASTCKGWKKDYAAWEVTVSRLELDGTVRRETGNRVMDLRDGSSQATAMREKVIAQNKRERDQTKWKDPDAQLREQRLHIGAHAETKAWQRAVRTMLGIRTYTVAELAKPFVVAKLQFTGRTNDPVLRMMFAQGLMNAALGGIAQLYGAPPAPSYQLGAGAPPPPQLGAGGPERDLDDENDDDAFPPQAPAARTDPPSNRGAHAGPPTPPRGAGQPRGGAAIDPTTFFFRFGREKEVPLCQIQDLAWYEKALVADLDDPKKEQWRARNEAVLEAVRAQMRRNAGEVDEDGGAPESPDGDRGDDPNNY